MTRSVAGHTVDYALHRYQLKDRVAQEDIDRAQGEMYNFLKRKLGSPTAVCTQYISTGYGHFERAYGDEARTMLLGVSGRQKTGIPKGFKSGMSGKVYPQSDPFGKTPWSKPNPENGTCEDNVGYCRNDEEKCYWWGVNCLPSTEDSEYGTHGQYEEYGQREAPTPPTLGEREVPGFSSGEPTVQGERPWYEQLGTVEPPPTTDQR